MSIDQEKLIEIARECGAVIDVLCMGRHDNVVFTSGEIQRFVQRIEQPYVDTIEDLHDEIGRLRAEIADLKLKLEAERFNYEQFLRSSIPLASRDDIQDFVNEVIKYNHRNKLE